LAQDGELAGMQAWDCPCGTRNGAQHDACRYCGRLPGQIEYSGTTDPVRLQPPPKGFRWSWGAFFGGVLLGFLGVLYGILLLTSLRHTSKDPERYGISLIVGGAAWTVFALWFIWWLMTTNSIQ
jgi:hypothetical protein